MARRFRNTAFMLSAVLIVLTGAGRTPAVAASDTLRLQRPINCEPGQNCWLVNYVDVDPQPEDAADFRCGPLTYDGHDGTDIALRNRAVMDAGVDVLAAAAGTVKRIRDEMEDRVPAAGEIETMKADKKGCGNGVYIDHGNGWGTIYCHMKKDSITVAPEQVVKAGDKIGEVGHSGIAEFPHLHFAVFFEDHTLDPFTGHDTSTGCHTADPATPLWTTGADMHYVPVSVYDAGFETGVPDFDRIKAGKSTPEQESTWQIRAFTFWAALFGVTEGDRISMEITDSQGRIFARREMAQDKTRARQFYYVGKKLAPGDLPPGHYTGTLNLTRDAPDGQTITRNVARDFLVTP